MAEPIEMQFGMLNRVGPGSIYYVGVAAARDGALIWCRGIRKHHCKT